MPIALARSSGTARVRMSVPSLAALGPPARLDDDGRGRIEDQGGAHVDPCSIASHASAALVPLPASGEDCADRLDHQRVDDDLGVFVPIAEAPAVQARRSRAHLLGGRDRRSRASCRCRRCAAARGGAARSRSAWTPCSISASRARCFKLGKRCREILAERLQPARLADRLHVGDADAVGRQHAGERMDQDPLHAERVGDRAGMLAARAAEAGERVAGDVMASRDRDLADRRGHVVDRDVEETLGDLLEALAADRVGDLLQPRARRFADRAAGRRSARTPPGNAPGRCGRGTGCSR